MRSHIWMAVGLPASGKSTWIKENCSYNTTSKIITLGTDRLIDEIAEREGKTYSDVFSDNIEDVTKLFFAKLNFFLALGDNIVVDRTNLNVKSRRKILQYVPKHYKKIALVFTCDPLDQAFRLLNRPGKYIPDSVIQSMRETYQKPTLNEGFDEILEFKS